MDRVGLIVGRFQPLHKGHTRIINHMIEDCSTVIVGLGSVQKSREKHDPWNVEERKQMLRNVYGDRIKIVPLKDLGTEPGTQGWADYVLEKIRKLGLPAPTDYFTGSHADAVWYKGHFYSGMLNDIYDDERFLNYIVPGTSTRYRMLHVIERNDNPVPPATDIRSFLELRDEGWRRWVPAVNHSIVEQNYPEEFKVPKK
jgi:cytidyltransferase-like protein